MPTGGKNHLYRKFSDFLKDRFGDRVYRVTVDGGFTCPNRDGKKGNQPCLFCDELGSGARHIDLTLSLKDQYLKGCEMIRKKLNIHKFIPYFQSFTNTYAPFETCVERYEAVMDDNAVGLAIGTRPDCLEDRLIDYLGTLSREKLIILDLGVQSITDRVLKIIHRGHDSQTTFNTLEKLAEYPGIHTVIHLMFGLPTETRDEMLASIKLFTKYNAKGVKFHQLNILKKTGMETLYNEGKVSPIPLEDYTSVVAEFLEHIPPDVVVHRLSARADSHPSLIAPLWGKYHHKPTQVIINTLNEKKSYQGKFFSTV